jgi:hypothetical protein
MKANRSQIVAPLAALACAATFAIAQPPAAVSPNSPFAGTWEGKLNDLPGIDLRIEDAAGKISGVIVFYFQERTGADRPWRVTAEYPVPLLAPRVDGNTLTFEAHHHICHDCEELGPNARFRVQAAGPDELRLWKVDGQQCGADPGPGWKLTRRTTPAGWHDPSKRQGPLVSLEIRLAMDWGPTPVLFRAFRLTLP